MKKVFFGLFGLSLIGGVLYMGFMHSPPKEKSVLGTSPTGIFRISSAVSPTQKPLTRTPTKILFVPYWTVDSKKIDDHEYDQLVYFGIEGTASGITTSDPGYKKIDNFFQRSDPSKKTLLAVRMVNSEVNATLLNSKQAQRDIATESAALAQEKGFNGVALDFEMSAIAFDSVIKGISDFTKEFATAAKEKNLSFSLILYGDTFYRVRPYDVSALAKNADSIMIMAYDFHKANGDPGPNFPLSGKDTYGYDIFTMLEDFTNHVPVDKVTVIFGLYGYDWTLDGKKQTVGTATSVTLNEARQKFLTACALKNCQIKHDRVSAETEVTYKDNNNNDHDVWFEDMSSVKKKMEFLESKGIYSVGYWAYSYF